MRFLDDLESKSPGVVLEPPLDVDVYSMASAKSSWLSFKDGGAGE